jgi:hypothetical protein
MPREADVRTATHPVGDSDGCQQGGGMAGRAAPLVIHSVAKPWH